MIVRKGFLESQSVIYLKISNMIWVGDNFWVVDDKSYGWFCNLEEWLTGIME